MFQPYLERIDGGTFVHESDGYDLPPMVKERDETSTRLLAITKFLQSSATFSTKPMLSGKPDSSMLECHLIPEIIPSRLK